MLKVSSVQFLYKDYVVEISLEGLSENLLKYWNRAEVVGSFVEGKERLKELVIQKVGMKDLQEVWLEILEGLESLKSFHGSWKVWVGESRIGLGVEYV